MPRYDKFQHWRKKYLRPELGLKQLKNVIANIPNLGFKSFQEFMLSGPRGLFLNDAIYPFLAILLYEENEKPQSAFTEEAIAKRAKRFKRLDENPDSPDIEPSVAADCITFFFGKLGTLSQSSPESLFLLTMNPETNGERKQTKKKASRRGRTSAMKSSSGSAAGKSPGS